eukprot:NODE_241_length_11910_cov_1.082381.p2 type:complete len:377 gc:universal NODE_241_length_11910_cov_1.082381:1344-2474(+)
MSSSSQPLGTQRFGLEIPDNLQDLLSFIEERMRCSICLCNVNDPMRLPCNHIMCQECMKSAIKHSKTCPECRSKFVPRQAKLMKNLGSFSEEISALLPKLNEFVNSIEIEQPVTSVKRSSKMELLVPSKRKATRPNVLGSPKPKSKTSKKLDKKLDVKNIPSSPPPLRPSSMSSKSSFKKTVSFTEDALNIMEMNTDDMLNDSQVLGELDKLIKYVEEKKNVTFSNTNSNDIPTDEVFDQMSLSPAIYLEKSLRSKNLDIQHEGNLEIVELVIIPETETPHEFILECMLTIVNQCKLLRYNEPQNLNLSDGIKLPTKIASLKNTIIYHKSRNDLLSFIVEAQGGFVLDHYPHFNLANTHRIVKIKKLSEMSQFLLN